MSDLSLSHAKPTLTCSFANHDAFMRTVNAQRVTPAIR
jgi:hypothetical protein